MSLLARKSKRKIEPRVSDWTLARMNFLTGMPLSQLADENLQITVGGRHYILYVDGSGKLSLIGCARTDHAAAASPSAGRRDRGGMPGPRLGGSPKQGSVVS